MYLTAVLYRIGEKPMVYYSAPARLCAWNGRTERWTVKQGRAQRNEADVPCHGSACTVEASMTIWQRRLEAPATVHRTGNEYVVR